MSSKKRKPKKPKNKIVIGLEIALISLFVALVIRAFVVCGYIIPAGSMENTLLGGDVILAQKITFHLRNPRPNELVVFRYPLNPKKYFTKRVIATSGQTVEIIDKVLYVDGRLFEEPETIIYPDPEILDRLYSNRDNFGPYVVPPKSIFVMGDNRDESKDSRDWGELPLKNVQGKPMFVYFSWADDPNQPPMEGIVDVFGIIWYNIMHIFDRLRIGRIGVIPH